MKLSEDKDKILIEVEIGSVLKTIPDRDIYEYAKKHFDMIDESDADDYCDCDVRSIDDYHDFELIDELSSRGYHVFDINSGNQSIVRELAMEKLVELLSKKSDYEVSQLVDKLM